MRKFKKITISIMSVSVLAGLSLNTVAQDWQDLSLDSQWEYIENNNSSLADSLKRYDDNAKLLNFDILDTGSVSINSSTRFDLDASNDAPDQAEQDVDVELSGAIKLNNAIELSGSVDTNEQASVSVNYNVFANPYVTAQMQYDYEKSKLDFEQLQLELKQSLQSKFLNVLLLEKKWKLSQTNQKLKTQAYLAMIESFELAQSTFEEKSDARSAKIQADNAVYQAQNLLLQAQLEYAQLSGEQTLADLSVDTFIDIVESRQEYLDVLLVDHDFSSSTLADLKLEKAMLATQRKQIKSYEPDLNVSSTYDVDDPSISLGVSVKFSLSQFGQEEQNEKNTEIAFNQSDIQMEQQNLVIQKQMLIRQLDMAENLLQSQIATFEEQIIITRETEYLYDLGERTQLELLQQQYNLEISEISKFEAVNDWFTIQQSVYLALAF